MKKCDSLLEETLDDEIWKDSFDRLLNKRSLLRQLKVLKSDVRASFNNDSSIEASGSYISKPVNLQENKNKKEKLSSSISTPILINKTFGPFECPLSPISSWRLTNFNQREERESSNKGIVIPFGKAARLCQQSTNSKKSYCEKLKYEAFNNMPNIKITADGSTDETDRNQIKEINSQISKTISDEVNLSVILPPGKWRRSLTVWKRINQRKYESLDHISKNDTNRPSQTFHKQTPLRISLNTAKSKMKLLKICQQKAISSFSSIYSNIALRKCRKIGEGTYGEVFLNLGENGETVFKIIPVEGNLEVNGESQKTFDQILPEVIITSELSNLRQSSCPYRTSGFVYLKNVRCIKGKYPDHLIELWNLYEKNYGSENDHPGMFQDSQIYVAMEIAYGGKDLEGFIFRNAEQSYATFLQITFSLAVAERRLQFEHRDLHCGNILLQLTNEKHVEYMINNKLVNIQTKGVKVTIIDYTLSRMLLDKCYYYNDLSQDDELFCAKGDYQYDIYRMMKEKLRNDWKTFDPQTNVMWLHYILTKLLDEAKYKNCRSKLHLVYIERMKTMRNTILSHSSAFEFSRKIYV